VALPKEVREKEEQIKSELEKLRIKVEFRIDRVDPKTRAWEHTVGFYDVPSKEHSDKVWEIIRKYHTQWKMESDLETLGSSPDC
jgi:hypothetical protein